MRAKPKRDDAPVPDELARFRWREWHDGSPGDGTEEGWFKLWLAARRRQDAAKAAWQADRGLSDEAARERLHAAYKRWYAGWVGSAHGAKDRNE